MYFIIGHVVCSGQLKRLFSKFFVFQLNITLFTLCQKHTEHNLPLTWNLNYQQEMQMIILTCKLSY